jgi:hypothetical protein
MSDSPARSVVSDAPGTPTVSGAPAEGMPAEAGLRAQADRVKSSPLGAESLICPTCQGVIVGVDAGAYTILRGQLIVSNGYCQGNGCGAARPAR